MKKPKKNRAQKPDAGAHSDVVSASEIAEWISASLSHVSKLVPILARRGRDVKAAHGKYHLKTFVQAYCAYKSDIAADADANTPRARKAAAEAARAEFELARERGEFVPVADAVALFTDFITVARSRLLMLEAKVPATARAETKELVHETLAELSNHDQSELIANLVASHGGGMDSAAKNDGERVG